MDHYQHSIHDICLSYSYLYASAIESLFKAALYRSRGISILRDFLLAIDPFWLSLQALLAYLSLVVLTLKN